MKFITILCLFAAVLTLSACEKNDPQTGTEHKSDEIPRYIQIDSQGAEISKKMGSVENIPRIQIAPSNKGK
jgi:hypothetical protein